MKYGILTVWTDQPKWNSDSLTHLLHLENNFF